MPRPRVAWQGYLEIIVWDVGHGNATSVRLPNGSVLMLDCGSNPQTGFSPVRETLRRWNCIDALFISHPHMDHIGDIGNIVCRPPNLVVAPQVPDKQVLENKQGDDLGAALSYTNFKNGCKPLTFDPVTIFGDVIVAWFFLDEPHADMNAYSIVTFLQYGSFTFLYAGDLPSRHWPDLMYVYGKRFTDLLSATNFFEASHHGRDEGYSSDAMSLMKDPLLALVSDKEEQKTSVTGKYDRYLKGWPAYNEATGESKDRKVLTTRNDGLISLRAWPTVAGADPCVEVRFGGSHG